MQCIIVDDEPQARKLLQTYLLSIGGITVTRLCSSAVEAYEALNTGNIDLMFLDIKMPVLTGADFLRSLKHPPLTIFTTAYTQYAVEGYELDVLDYLVKPVSMARLLMAIDKARIRLQEKATAQPGYIFIKQDGKAIKVMLDEIAYIEGMQNYVKIYLKDNTTLIMNSTMKAMEEVLPGDNFTRIHRSYIVSIPAITAIAQNMVECGPAQLPVGQQFKENILRILGKL